MAKQNLQNSAPSNEYSKLIADRLIILDSALWANTLDTGNLYTYKR